MKTYPGLEKNIDKDAPFTICVQKDSIEWFIIESHWSIKAAQRAFDVLNHHEVLNGREPHYKLRSSNV